MQDDHSLSEPAFTSRGLHFRTPSRGQDKLLRRTHDRRSDVAVDIRRRSPTYGRWVGTEFTDENVHQPLIPIGCAHGFVPLEPDCEVACKCSNIYSPEHGDGFRWDDGAVGAAWPIPAGTSPELSAEGTVKPPPADVDSSFSRDDRPLALLA